MTIGDLIDYRMEQFCKVRTWQTFKLMLRAMFLKRQGITQMIIATAHNIRVKVSPQTAMVSDAALSALAEDVEIEMAAFRKRLEVKLITKHKLALTVSLSEE